MQYYSKEQIQRARKTDLYDYLMCYHAGQFKQEGQSIHPIGNGSLSIKRGYTGYMDFATGETGNSVDFLVKHMGYALDEAVFALCGETSPTTHSIPIPNDIIAEEKLSPIFPNPAEGRYKQLFAFLTGRGIPSATIQGLIDQKLLYQSGGKNNAVFINREKDWAELRGTYTMGEKQFHGVVPNSRTDGFWYFQFGKNPKTAYVCEAAIDAVSLYILQRKHGMNENAYYVSIGGVAKQPAIDRIKHQVKTILAVDNDEAGEQCRKRNSDLEYIIPIYKDWNEELQKS